jgi:anti-sigma regulatory factor (Ser/Thr protein kinase)
LTLAVADGAVTANEGTMSTSAQWLHQDRFAAGPSSVVGVRWFIASHLREHDLSDLVDDVQLVASELATNALVHAQPPFTVTLQGFETFVFLTIRDGSRSQPVRVVAEPMATSGRGLSIVEAVSSDWGVHQTVAGEKWIWAAFDRKECVEHALHALR